jgi:hypothetical protein
MAMVWILLAALGVPVWLVVGALAAGLWSRRAFKRAPGVFPAKLRVEAGEVPGFKTSWPRGAAYARWVHDVLLVHRGLALVRNNVLAVAGANGPLVVGGPEEITRLGPSPVVLSLTLDGGATVELAGRSEDRDAVVGPYPGVLL